MSKRTTDTYPEKLWENKDNLEKAFFELQLHVNAISNFVSYYDHQAEAGNPKDKKYWLAIKNFYAYLLPIAEHMLRVNKTKYDNYCKQLTDIK
jgi:hypothetical protein